LKIYGFLYKSENTNNKYNEMLNSSAFISSKYSYENNTEINYIDNNFFEICFNNMNKNYYKYDMQIKINIIFNDYFFKEDSLVYICPIDLTEELKKEKKNTMTIHTIFLIFLIIFIIIVLLIFIIMYFKLKNKNKHLEKIAFCNPISLNPIDSEEVFSEDSKENISDKDYYFV